MSEISKNMHNPYDTPDCGKGNTLDTESSLRYHKTYDYDFYSNDRLDSDIRSVNSILTERIEF